MFGHGMTFSVMFITKVASIAVTSRVEPPGVSEYVTWWSVTKPLMTASGGPKPCWIRTPNGSSGRNGSRSRMLHSPITDFVMPKRTRSTLASSTEQSIAISWTASTSGAGAGTMPSSSV